MGRLNNFLAFFFSWSLKMEQKTTLLFHITQFVLSPWPKNGYPFYP
jgi:hypothetical protein